MEQKIIELHDLSPAEWKNNDLATEVQCAGNQHKCMPTVFIPDLNRRFDLKFEGRGDSVIIGHHLGPRALIWKNTQLYGHHDELGKMTVSLKENKDHAGTITPVNIGSSFPAINRNTYFFKMEIENFGTLISEKPAIVEALIDSVPPSATYEFKNGPLNFYMENDPSKRTVMVLEGAQTEVRP
ncbi:MAG TPA: hypothetical protein VNR87_13420 [Flavisolibacter sp.]|nr:hypothetical protein [Flavisolibacter sp.]